jgi:hypothetical protein
MLKETAIGLSSPGVASHAIVSARCSIEEPPIRASPNLDGRR